MTSLINLFFVPMIAVYIYYSRRKEKLIFSLEFVVKYCVITAAVFVITKGLLTLVGIFTSFTLNIGGIIYAVSAVIVSVLLPLALAFIKKYVSIRVCIEKNEESK